MRRYKVESCVKSVITEFTAGLIVDHLTLNENEEPIGLNNLYIKSKTGINGYTLIINITVVGSMLIR